MKHFPYTHSTLFKCLVNIFYEFLCYVFFAIYLFTIFKIIKGSKNRKKTKSRNMKKNTETATLTRDFPLSRYKQDIGEVPSHRLPFGYPTMGLWLLGAYLMPDPCPNRIEGRRVLGHLARQTQIFIGHDHNSARLCFI